MWIKLLKQEKIRYFTKKKALELLAFLLLLLLSNAKNENLNAIFYFSLSTN